MGAFEERFTQEMEKTSASSFFDYPSFRKELTQRVGMSALPIFGASMAISVLPKMLGTNPTTAGLIGGSLGAATAGSIMLGREIGRYRKGLPKRRGRIRGFKVPRYR